MLRAEERHLARTFRTNNVTRALAALTLFLASSLSAATIPVAPRDVVGDRSTIHSRPVVSAATNGSTFIVAWQDNAMRLFDTTSSDYVRTYDAFGTPEQTLPVPIAGRIGPAVVWSGTEWIVGSCSFVSPFDSFSTSHLLATRVSEHATESGPATELAANSRAMGYVGAVANGSDLFFGNSGGAVVTSSELQPRVHIDQPLRPLAAADGTFLAQGSNSAAVVSRDGAIVQNIATSNVMGGASNGHEYAIVYAANHSLEALIAASDGTITNRQTLELNVDAREIEVIRRGDSYLAGWTTADQNLCFATFTATTKSAVQCTAMPGLQSFSLADNGTRTLLAWSGAESTFERDHVYTSFSPSSTLPLLGQTSEATTMLRPQSQPQLALDPNGVTAVWTDGHIPFIGGVDRGTSHTRPPRPVMLENERVSNLRVARSVDATLVLWLAQNPASSGDPELRVSIIPDAPFAPQQNLTLGDAAGAEVTSDGHEWLVVWQKFVTSRLEMRSTIITANGTIVSPEGLLLAPANDAQQGQLNIAVASRGSDFLVAWTEDHSNGRQLLATSVSTAGTPVGVMDLASGPINGIKIAANGRFYFIVVNANNIGFPVTSIIPDILVAGVPDAPFAVHARGDGFAVLHGFPIRATYVDALGNDFDGGVLAVSGYDFDFVYDGPRLVLARSVADGWSSQVLLDLFAPRIRATAR